MSKTNKPGIHLFKTTPSIYDKVLKSKPEWYWHAVSKNGRITADGKGLNTKRSALKSISSAAKSLGGSGSFRYYDHSKPDSPLQSYL